MGDANVRGVAIVRCDGGHCSRSLFSLSSDGIGRTGTFCAAYSMIERVKVERVVDAFQTVKYMRIQRAGLLDSLVSSNECPNTYCLIAYFPSLSPLPSSSLSLLPSSSLSPLPSSSLSPLPFLSPLLSSLSSPLLSSQAQYIFLYSALFEYCVV